MSRYKSDGGIFILTHTPTSALHALCLRSWPAVRTVSLDLAASDNSYDCFLSGFRLNSSYMTVMIASEMHSIAFQCIAQPNTTFA